MAYIREIVNYHATLTNSYRSLSEAMVSGMVQHSTKSPTFTKPATHTQQTALASKKPEHPHHPPTQRTPPHIQRNPFTFNKTHSHPTKSILIQQNSFTFNKIYSHSQIHSYKWFIFTLVVNKSRKPLRGFYTAQNGGFSSRGNSCVCTWRITKNRKNSGTNNEPKFGRKNTQPNSVISDFSISSTVQKLDTESK